jgi:predicted membrane protein
MECFLGRKAAATWHMTTGTCRVTERRIHAVVHTLLHNLWGMVLNQARRILTKLMSLQVIFAVVVVSCFFHTAKIFTDASQRRSSLFIYISCLFNIALKMGLYTGRSFRGKDRIFRFVFRYKSAEHTSGTVIVYFQVLQICSSKRTIWYKGHVSSARKAIGHRIRI